jgi:peptide/nickel transport system permease protein
MLAYTIRRLILIIPTLILVTMMVFLTVRFIPGDVIDMMVAQMSGSGSVSTNLRTAEGLRAVMGLDAPIQVQYGRWLGVWPQKEGGFHGVIQGDLGKSLWKNRSVTSMLGERLPVSIELGVIAMITALLSSIPIGVYSAIRQDTWGDYLGRTLSILFISVPSFWIATMVMVYPAIWWGWAPSLVYIPLTDDVPGNLVQFVLPGFIMGMVMGGTLMRMTRTMMLEVLRQDYIRTAWAKGLNERTVIVRHALKNAFIPVVTIIGVMVPMIVGGTIVIEQIFVLPGVGLLTFEALNLRDYPVISGVNLFLATVVLIVNLLVDLTYAWLDPRIKYR